MYINSIDIVVYKSVVVFKINCFDWIKTKKLQKQKNILTISQQQTNLKQHWKNED